MLRFMTAAAVVLFAVSPSWTASAEESSGEVEKEASQAEPDETVTLKATDFEFTPEEFDAKVGDVVRVELVNEGNVAHSYVAEKLSVKTEKVLPGESTTVTFTAEEAGEIEFVCDVPGHEQIGMKGTLHVRE